ncbi:3'-5' exonuclease, partial [Amycolatopsis sp. SID8362]|uniref:PD-(D/E)XK nuclease family protein n=1 Tax=Amycolatopsis sp. SID8362 TaxID=2690346 RepID=UPI001429B4FA
ARLLTGARWRLAAADVAALWRRAGELSSPEKSDTPELVVERVEQAGLIDAIDEPGAADRYSEEGYRRIRRIGWELAALRRRLDQSLPELVADVERTMLLDVESLARPGSAGRAHLDAFAEVVTDYAETAPTATLLSFVDYLNTAAHAEDGLTPGEVEVVPDRVQVLTVHSSKGLEWEVVAVPHLVHEVFPGRRRSSSWLRTATSLPAALRGDAEDLPELRIAEGYDRKEVQEGLELHEAGFVEREQAEERRLCYVALTRSEHALIVSGHWWNESSSRAKGPSEFLTEIADVLRETGVGQLADWAPEPGADDENPLVSDSRKARWPVDPLADRRTGVQTGVELVSEAMSTVETSEEDEDDPDGWLTDTDVLLEEWARKDDHVKRVPLPSRLTVSQLVTLADDSARLASDLRRPLPAEPNSFARRGTEFHGWLERRFGGDQLIEIDDLPGAADFDEAPDADFEELRAAFEESEWAEKVPEAVEISFSADVEGITLRGRMDAVFRHADGSWEVVDWKTGSVPPESRLPALAVQLAAYRMAWAALKNVPVEQVRAAFHYVRANHTIRPADLLDAEGLRRLLRDIPEA